MLKCVVGSFKAYCKTCKKVLLFVISAQTASVTVLKSVSVLYDQLCDRQLYICSCTKSWNVPDMSRADKLFKHSYNHLQPIFAV